MDHITCLSCGPYNFSRQREQEVAFLERVTWWVRLKMREKKKKDTRNLCIGGWVAEDFSLARGK